MNPIGLGREVGAILLGVIAYGENEIKCYGLIFIDVIGSVAGYINAIFFHHFDGYWIHTMRFNTRTVDLNFSIAKVSYLSLSHLTAA